jgi:hypothetical protein
MALSITEANHRELDAYLDAVLNSYRNGHCNLSDARGSLAQVISAGLRDLNFMGEVRGHTKLFLRHS